MTAKKERSVASPRRRAADEWITLLTGRADSGKSYRMRQLLQAEKGAVIAWDPSNSLGKLAWEFEGKPRELLKRIASGEKIDKARCWGNRKSFALLCHYVRRRGRLTFAVDEAHVFVPMSLSQDHPFAEVCVQVRHLKTPLIVATWRPQDLPRYLRSGTSRIYAFRTTDARSIDYLTSEAGAAPSAAATLPGLHTGPTSGGKRFLTWRP